MAVGVKTWMAVGALALATAVPAAAQFPNPFSGPYVQDHTGAVINGQMSYNFYRAPQMPQLWIVPNYVFHYEAPQPLFVPAPVTRRPAVESVPVSVVTLRKDATPSDLRVGAGSVVTWVNAGDAERTVVVNLSGMPAESGRASLREWRVRSNGSFSLTFRQPGVYEYHMQDRPEERGRIVVGE